MHLEETSREEMRGEQTRIEERKGISHMVFCDNIPWFIVIVFMQFGYFVVTIPGKKYWDRVYQTI